MFKVGDKLVNIQGNLGDSLIGDIVTCVDQYAVLADRGYERQGGVFINRTEASVDWANRYPEYFERYDYVRVKEDYSLDHYNNIYALTPEDIEAGVIKVDAYWVAKQWKTGSRDDSGALWHSLKTIARFGEKNSKEREIKALYNQAKALARIYGVELE